MPKIRQRKKNKSELVDLCALCFKKCMSACGIGLILAFLSIVCLLMYTLIYDVLKLHYFVLESPVIVSVRLILLVLTLDFLVSIYLVWF